MSRIADILMRRDGMDKYEAQDLIAQTKFEIQCAIADGNYCEVEDIIADNLGLEPDYIFDLI